MSLYEILGVNNLANKKEIKSAYHKKIKTCHPDIGGDPQEFKNIVRAYLILYDEQSRAKYDSKGVEETPNDRKPIEWDKLAESLALKVIFSISDSLGDSICNKNIREIALNNFKDIEKDLKSRLNNNKNTWKALRKKYKAILKKLDDIKNIPNNFLYKALELKSRHVEIQEILPIKEDCRKILEDLKICMIAKKLIENSSDNYIDTSNIEDSLYLWDQSFRGEQYNPYNVDNSDLKDHFLGETIW